MPVDPDIAALLRRLADRPMLHELPPPESRTSFDALCRMLREQAPEVVAHVEDTTIAGPAGPIPARLYRPETGDGPRPAVLYVHGGGWVVGGLDSYDAICRRLAADTGSVVVSIDYRLAPDHPFPAAVDDVMAAARWVSSRPEGLGELSGWGMGGDSAGGNLTAVATHLLRDEGDTSMAAQLLVYPSVDMPGRYASRTENATGFNLELETMGWFSRQYMLGEDPRDPRLSPLFYPSHEGLPPAVIVTAEFDPLRDEGSAYAAALREAGVEATLLEEAGLVHGFYDMVTISPGAAAAVARAHTAYRTLLHRTKETP